MKTIIPISGGVDSTAAAYHYLKSHPNETVLLLHVHLKNGETAIRSQLERQSVLKVVEYFKSNSLNNFEFKEAGIDYTSGGEIPPVWDIETINFFVGVYVRDTSIVQMVKGTNFDDFQQEDFMDRIESSEEVFYAISRMKKGEFKFLFPQKEMTKQEVHQSIPEELLELTWSCRRPQSNNGHYVPCGVCDTCRMTS